ncbi:class I SAM-dependent methyltransferase [Petrachloros mirabilis]
MGLYSQHIFPCLMDWMMSGEEFQRLRAELLRNARGEVVEIGFGTGLNFAHYLPAITSLTVVDPAHLLPHKVADRAKSVSFPVQVQHATAESLPFPDRRFDTAVSTWTLCTIQEPVKAIREIRRILKTDGRFLFLEHGRSDDPRVAVWQDRLNPIQNIIGCGCNLNRRIDQLIDQGGLQLLQLDRFKMAQVPRIGGEMYCGQAIPKATF